MMAHGFHSLQNVCIKRALVTATCALTFFSGMTYPEYLPDAGDLGDRHTKSSPHFKEIEHPLRKILQSEVDFCGCSYRNKNFKLVDVVDTFFVSIDESQCSAFLTVEKLNLPGKRESYQVTSRCCPMGPCHTSYFFQKDNTGEWRLFDRIEGEVFLYKPGKDGICIGVADTFVTNINYVGTWEKGMFTSLIAYPPRITFPERFTSKSIKIVKDGTLQVTSLPAKADSSNNPPRTVKVPASREIVILAEKDNYLFVMIKASPDEIIHQVMGFGNLADSFLNKARPRDRKIKIDELREMLDGIYYEFGWISK